MSADIVKNRPWATYMADWFALFGCFAQNSLENAGIFGFTIRIVFCIAPPQEHHANSGTCVEWIAVHGPQQVR